MFLYSSAASNLLDWPKKTMFFEKKKKKESVQINPQAHLPVSKQVYPHFTKQPKMVTREMLCNKKFFQPR